MRLPYADNPVIYMATLLTLCASLCVDRVQAFSAATDDPVPQRPIAAEIRATLLSLNDLGVDKPANLDALTHVYKGRDYQPLWCDDDGVTTAAHYWIALLSAAEQQGITQVSNIRLQLEERLNVSRPADVADLDLMLSDSFLQYAGTLANGQFNATETDPAWHIRSARIQPVKLIEQIAQSSQPQRVYKSLLPSHKNYQALHSALLHYLWIAESGGWPRIDVHGPQLQVGDEGDEVLRIREILWATGDLPEDTLKEPGFDSGLQRALERFQQRHGLDTDGVVGQRTRRALAVSVEQRIQQMRLNLERWRWLPRDLGERYIMVNSAAFELQAHQEGRAPLSMRVVVGRRDRQTPVFMEHMRYMIVNPYWHVPGRLARRDLIPALIDQPDYFFKRRIRVLSGWKADAEELNPLDINWQNVLESGSLPYKLRQDPGPKNALGRIKFMLPNHYSVYLHDTPGKHLFERPVRTFSSGCVRVEKPLALASFALGNNAQSPESLSELQALIGQGETRTVSLPEPLPVYMVYQTAWVEGDGDVHFRDDVYQRDRRLAARLKQTRVPKMGRTGVKTTSIAQAIDNLP